MTELHESHVQSGSPPNEEGRSDALPFHEILEQMEHLSAEDQEALMDMIRRRRAALRRAEIAENVRKSTQEFAAGLANSGTVDELMEQFRR
jgi:hypothetical protein